VKKRFPGYSDAVAALFQPAQQSLADPFGGPGQPPDALTQMQGDSAPGVAHAVTHPLRGRRPRAGDETEVM
jgi:hypothetical protein